MSAPLHEPHKFKSIRNLSFPDLDERKRFLADARFNVFHLTQDQVVFEMTAAGMGAMSQEQLGGLFVGDEAYAGARNFETLRDAVQERFGKGLVCPTHNLRGSLKLVLTTMVPAGSRVGVNGAEITDLLEPRQIAPVALRAGTGTFGGDLDLALLERALGEGLALLWLESCADGMHPMSLANLQEVRALAEKHGVRVVLDASRVMEQAWMIRRHEAGQSARPLTEIVRAIAAQADILAVDAAHDARCQVGGLLAADNPEDFEKFMNEVVVFEGLHTYGGMTGRTMEVFARGLRELGSASQIDWIMHQAELFCSVLADAGVPFVPGCDGAYLRADRFLPHLDEHQQDTLSAALYLATGVRAQATGRVGRDLLVPVQIPRLTMTDEQLEQIAAAIGALYDERAEIGGLSVLNAGAWRDEMRYRWIFPLLEDWEPEGFPFVVHSIEYVSELSKQERRRAVEEAGYNTFLLRSADVTIDLLTDSGTAAMSTEQWAEFLRAVPTNATANEYHALVEVLREAFGYEHIIPTHQGRAAEHILSQCHIRPGQLVPGNMYFTTTKLHQEKAGGVFADIIVDEAHDPQSTFRWKGNVDLTKLDALVQEHGASQIAYISYEHSVNMAGGQPCSMQNMKDVYAYCSARGIPVFFDSTRCMENACMIARFDPAYRGVPAAEILREMMSYGDGCTISGKKDFIINMGGILAFRDNVRWKEQAEDMLRVWEGNVTDGGLPACDLAAIAQGVTEMLDDRYIHSRLEQTALLGDLLLEAGVPIVTPPGSHAIFVDAKRFLPHVDQDAYPAQRLAAEIFIETGVRAMERGNVSKGRNWQTGENYRPALELVRLTIPRRVYSNEHMRAVAEGIARLYQRRSEITGLKMVYEPKELRFFQARFEPI
ncbi:MAG: tryptophanase [Pseudomonadota bacterium]